MAKLNNTGAASTGAATEKKFVSVGGANATESTLRFIRPSELAENGIKGEVLEGVFVEALPNQLDSSKLDYKFQTEDGQTVIINGTGSLSYRMKSVTPGTLTKVIYNGKEKIKKGKMAGREAHSFDVLIAAE